MFLQSSILREVVCQYGEDALFEIRQQTKEEPGIRAVLGFVSRARALELIDEGKTAGIGKLTSLRYLLAHPGVHVEFKLTAKTHIEKAGHGVTAEDCRTVYAGDGNLALNYAYNFRVCGVYSPEARRLTSGPKQTLMLERSRLLREAMTIGEGIS